MKSRKSAQKENVVLDTLSIDYVAPSDLAVNDYNPNRQSEHDFELLCKSIDEDGFTQPVVALRETRVIVDGEHRWRAAQTLGLAEIPVVFTDMTPAQARIATLRHNRARGNEDVELAAAVLKDLSKLGATEWLQDSLNMDDVELDAFLAAVDDQEGFSNAEALAMSSADDEVLKQMVRDEGGYVEEHESASVQDVVRAREQRIHKEKRSQDLAQAAIEHAIYRLKLVYTGDESKVIKRVLGKRPIERLLEICRQRVG